MRYFQTRNDIKIKKKPYAKRKTEDYILSRKLKFFYSRLTRALQIFAMLLLVAAIGWLIWAFNFDEDNKVSKYIHNKSTQVFISMGLKIESVEIEGNKIVPTDLILQKLFESLGDVSKKSIILIDLDDLKEKLTSIGWVDSVEIRRKLPGALIIHVNERQPKVIWQSKGKIWLADEYGNLLTQKFDQKYSHLPLIIGYDSVKDVPELFEIIKSSPKLSPLVIGATKVGNRRWDISLTNKLKVKLPEENALQAWNKLDELQKKHSLFSKKINYIDLRIENQLITGLEPQENNEIELQKQKLPVPGQISGQ